MRSERVKRLLREWVMTDSTTGLPQIAQEGAGGGAIPLMEVMKKVVVEVGVGRARCVFFGEEAT